MKATNRSLISAGICGIALLAGGIGTATAAAPAYCALYAREYTAQFATGSDADAAIASEYRILEQAYSRCLNLDVEPAFPETSAYFGASVGQIVAGTSGPFEEIAEGDTNLEDDPPIDEPALIPAEPAAVAEPLAIRTATRDGTSGNGGTLQKFSPEWQTWCKEHYPNSFDPISGMVTPFEGEPRLCPVGQ